MSSSALLVSELQHIQHLLGSKGGGGDTEAPYSAALLPPVAAHRSLYDGDGSESEDEDVVLKAARSASQDCVRTLRCEAEALRQQVKLAEEEAERRAARAARKLGDSAAIVERLQAQLRQQQAESNELSQLVLALRDENDMLQQHAKEVAEQAQRNERDAAQGVQQLRAAARQWRQQHEEVMRQLVQEQEQLVALRSELKAAREQQQLTEEALERERKEHQQAIARTVGMEAALGSQGQQAACSQEVIASLRDKLRTERSWRKATQVWLRAELHTKGELERLLINLGTSVQLGHVGQALPTGAPPVYPAVAPSPWPQQLSAASAPPLMGQPMAQPSGAAGSRKSLAVWSPAGQQPLDQQQVPPEPQVPPPPPPPPLPPPQQQLGYAQPTSSPPMQTAPTDWRSAFDATLQSFEARYNKLAGKTVEGSAGASPLWQQPSCSITS